ncbi:hypothetical protein MRX96_018088 [Rhipicephalus microplus]
MRKRRLFFSVASVYLGPCLKRSQQRGNHEGRREGVAIAATNAGHQHGQTTTGEAAARRRRALGNNARRRRLQFNAAS